MKVLLIAADAALRKNLPLVMASAGGAELVLARDVDEASRRAGERFDVAIVDLHAPGPEGLRMLREARAAFPGPVLAALAMRIYDEYRAACLAAGADYLLDKSGDFRDLAQIVRPVALDRAGRGQE